VQAAQNVAQCRVEVVGAGRVKVPVLQQREPIQNRKLDGFMVEVWIVLVQIISHEAQPLQLIAASGVTLESGPPLRIAAVKHLLHLRPGGVSGDADRAGRDLEREREVFVGVRALPLQRERLGGGLQICHAAGIPVLL
jgi:hypothetical protein